jgi:hypothetical protein
MLEILASIPDSRFPSAVRRPKQNWELGIGGSSRSLERILAPATRLLPFPAARRHRLGLPYETVAARMSAAVSTCASSIHSSAVWA